MPTAAPKQANNSQTARSQKKEIEVIRKFFYRVREKLVSDYELSEGSSKQKPFKNVLFHCNDYFFLFNAKDKFQLLEWSAFEEASKKPNFETCPIECTIQCDATTMIAIAEGEIRPMHAYLSGKLVVTGDKKAIRDYSPALLSAISRNIALEVRNKAGLTVEVLGVVGSGKGAESSPTTGENLSAHNSHVLKYSASNATSNGNSSDVTLSGHQYPVTNHSSQAQYGVVADTIVRYVFQVYDHYTHEKWQIIHRYSDFLKLRQDLLQQGFTNIPTIHTKSSFFYNQLEIINDRIIQLPLWLNQTIDIVMDYVTSKQGKEGNSPPQRSSLTLDDFLQNNSKGNFYIQQSSSIRKQKDLEESLKSVLIHNYSKGMITWNKRLMNNSRFILTEIQQLKLQIKHLEVVQSNLSSSSSSQSAFASMFQLNNESHSSEGEMRPKIAAINTASAPTNSNNLTSGSIPLGSSKNGGRLNILLQGVFGLLMFIFAELFVEEYCNHPLPFISFFHHHPIAPTASSYPIVSHWLERIQWMLSFDFFRGMFVRIMFLYYGLMNRSNRRAFVRYILLIIFLQSLFHHGMQVIVQTLYVPVSSSETSSAAASSTSHDEWRISTFTLRRFFILLMERSFTRTLQKIYVMYTNISIEINDLFHFPSISHLRTVITPYLAAVVSIATNANTSNAIDDAIESNNNAIEEVSNYDYYFRLLFSKLSLFLLIMIVLFYSYFQKQKTFQRNFQIYFHGFLLLIIYGFLLPLTCKTICKMIRIVSFLSFSSSTSSSSSSSPSSPNSSPTSNHDAILTQQIYDIVDSYIAPYFLYQIHSYRSIFIKFAQYFGTRSDMLLSDTWMTLLKELHDSCKASSFEGYIRPQIEQEINELYEFIPEYSFTHQGRKESQQKKKRKTWWTRNTTNTAHNTLQLEKEALWIELEDIFDYFDHQCVASASIGQVHFGTINVRKLDKIRLKQQPSQQQDEKKRVTLESLIREEKYIYAHDITHPYFSMYSNDHPDYLKQAMKQSEEIESSRSGNSTGKRLFTGSKGGGAGVVDDEFHDLINVAVKIQHDQVDQIMMSDLKIVKYFVDIAQGFDSRWNTMSTVINSWEDMLQKELNFQQEGRNIREVHKDMKDSQLGVITPYPINGLVTKKLLVMTCLHGYKITDRLALSIYEINREALLIRIAHALSYQLLVSGTLNADPHPGNLLFCLARRLPSNDVSSIYDDPYAEMSYDDGEVNLSTKSRKYTPENSNAVVSSPITSPTLNSPRPNGSSKKSRKRAQTYDNAYDDSNGQVDSVRYQFISGANADNGVNGDGPMLDGYHVVPGFLDFGMTIRIKTERRKLYCRLIIALFEKDLLSASKILQELGYKNTQSDRAPERDAEFFEYLFRDATTKANSVKESERFTEYRKRQKQEDMEKGVYEKNGRSMAQIPEDFLFVSRVIGCLRGLTAELDCHCPILYIMALHAKVGLHV